MDKAKVVRIVRAREAGKKADEALARAESGKEENKSADRIIARGKQK